jgi:hypothetical protein
VLRKEEGSEPGTVQPTYIAMVCRRRSQNSVSKPPAKGWAGTTYAGGFGRLVSAPGHYVRSTLDLPFSRAARPPVIELSPGPPPGQGQLHAARPAVRVGEAGQAGSDTEAQARANY